MLVLLSDLHVAFPKQVHFSNLKKCFMKIANYLPWEETLEYKALSRNVKLYRRFEEDHLALQ